MNNSNLFKEENSTFFSENSLSFLFSRIIFIELCVNTKRVKFIRVYSSLVLERWWIISSHVWRHPEIVPYIYQCVSYGALICSQFWRSVKFFCRWPFHFRASSLPQVTFPSTCFQSALQWTFRLRTLNLHSSNLSVNMLRICTLLNLLLLNSRSFLRSKFGTNSSDLNASLRAHIS